MAKKKKKKNIVAASVRTGARRARTRRAATRPVGRAGSASGTKKAKDAWPQVGNAAPLAGLLPYLKRYDYVKELRKMRDEWGD